MRLILSLALRNLGRNRRRSILAGNFIALTLVALILADGFMRGMVDDMVRRGTDDFQGHAQIHATGYGDKPTLGNSLPQAGTLRQRLASTPAVEAAAPRTLSPAQLISADNTLNVQLVGVDPAAEQKTSRLHQALLGGNRLDAGDTDAILLGRTLAERLQVAVGDQVTVTVATLPDGVLVEQSFRVGGLFAFNNAMLDEGMAVIPLTVSQQLLGLDDQVHQWVVRLTQPLLAQDEVHPVWQQLSGSGWEVLPWTKLMPDLASMVPMVEVSLYAIGALLFVLAGLGVVNTFFMSIHERTYEFGVLRSIGTRAGALGRLILSEALLLGLLSTLAGTLLGMALIGLFASTGVDYGTELEISGLTLQQVLYPVFSRAQVTGIPIAVLGLTLLACLYPAWHATRIQPARAMQHNQ